MGAVKEKGFGLEVEAAAAGIVENLAGSWYRWERRGHRRQMAVAQLK